MKTWPFERFHARRALATSLLPLVLAACGGGGSGGAAPQNGTGTGTGTGTGSGTDTGTGTGTGGDTGTSGGASTALQGVLITNPFPGVPTFDAAELDLAGDALAPLPRSAHSQSTNAQPDTWVANASAGTTSDLARVDWNGNVDFFDRKTLERTGGFSLAAIANTNQPSFWSEEKVSPDGKYLLAYWKADYHQSDAVLAVFDRQGNVVQQGSPVDYDAQSYWHAFDWLPDGRYVFLAGDTLVTATVGQQVAETKAISLPAGVGSRGSELSVSPDGTQFALKLGVALTDAQGDSVGRGLLFISDSAMTTFQQVTTLNARAQAGDGAVGHSEPRWSPDGKYIAFSIAFPGAAFGFSAPGCPEVIVLPATSRNVAIDDLSDPDSVQFVRTNPRTAASSEVRYCYANMSWIAKP